MHSILASLTIIVKGDANMDFFGAVELFESLSNSFGSLLFKYQLHKRLLFVALEAKAYGFVATLCMLCKEIASIVHFKPFVLNIDIDMWNKKRPYIIYYDVMLCITVNLKHLKSNIISGILKIRALFFPVLKSALDSSIRESCPHLVHKEKLPCP